MIKITIRAIRAVAFTSMLVGIMILIGSLDFPNSKTPLIQSGLFIGIGLIIYLYIGIKFKKELQPTKNSKRVSSVLGLLLIIFGILSAYGGFQTSNIISLLAGGCMLVLGVFFKIKSKVKIEAASTN